jgi:hypothetical protein
MTSSAAKKAWATRRKKNPKKWRKRGPAGRSDPDVFLVRDGKVVTVKESSIRGPATIYYSTFEAEQVAKHGPKWFMKGKK